MARFLELDPECIMSENDDPEFVLGNAGRFLRMLFIEYAFGELLC
jgi:hypothetical protein